MAASLRFAQILLVVGLVVVALVTLATLALVTRLGPVGLIAVIGAVLMLYALARTVVALQRSEAWAPVAAFWALVLFVISGVIEMIRLAPNVPIPVLGILAVIAIVVLPAGSRALLPADERRPPIRIAVAYLVALLVTVVLPVVAAAGI